MVTPAPLSVAVGELADLIQTLRLRIADLTALADAAEEYHWTHLDDGIGAKSDAEIRDDFTTAVDTYRRTRGIRELPPEEDDVR